ncbi:hypothetical protein C8J56DRAFT_1115610 [Mycena floridula]|nr:hypothetical protein C8J56DRAFT_1115610 [Mycena floridula]
MTSCSIKSPTIDIETVGFVRIDGADIRPHSSCTAQLEKDPIDDLTREAGVRATVKEMAKVTTAKEREIEKKDDRMSKCLSLIANAIRSRKGKGRKDTRKGKQGIDVDMPDAIPALIITPLSGRCAAPLHKPNPNPTLSPSPLPIPACLSTSRFTEPSQTAKQIHPIAQTYSDLQPDSSSNSFFTREQKRVVQAPWTTIRTPSRVCAVCLNRAAYQPLNPSTPTPHRPHPDSLTNSSTSSFTREQKRVVQELRTPNAVCINRFAHQHLNSVDDEHLNAPT